MSTERYEYADPDRSHPARIGFGVALGALAGAAMGLATGDLALWFPAFVGMGVALGVVLTTR